MHKGQKAVFVVRTTSLVSHTRKCDRIRWHLCSKRLHGSQIIIQLKNYMIFTYSGANLPLRNPLCVTLTLPRVFRHVPRSTRGHAPYNYIVLRLCTILTGMIIARSHTSFCPDRGLLVTESAIFLTLLPLYRLNYLHSKGSPSLASE